MNMKNKILPGAKGAIRKLEQYLLCLFSNVTLVFEIFKFKFSKIVEFAKNLNFQNFGISKKSKIHNFQLYLFLKTEAENQYSISVKK